MGLRSSDCATFTINIPQSPLFYVAQSNLNKMTPVRPGSGCWDGGSSCTFILFWRGAGSVVQLQSGREVLATVLNKWGERACAYLLSSFTCSAFLFFFSPRGDHGNANRSRDAACLVTLSAERWLLETTTTIRSCDLFLGRGNFFQSTFLQIPLDTN